MPTEDRSPEAPAVRVHLPSILTAVTGGVREWEARGATVRAVLEDLAASSPALGLHLFDEAGRIRAHIVCIHEGTVVRAHQAAEHEVQPGGEIILTNALAGG